MFFYLRDEVLQKYTNQQGWPWSSKKYLSLGTFPSTSLPGRNVPLRFYPTGTVFASPGQRTQSHAHPV